MSVSVAIALVALALSIYNTVTAEITRRRRQQGIAVDEWRRALQDIRAALAAASHSDLERFTTDHATALQAATASLQELRRRTADRRLQSATEHLESWADLAGGRHEMLKRAVARDVPALELLDKRAGLDKMLTPALSAVDEALARLAVLERRAT
jgi:hypothetical protein